MQATDIFLFPTLKHFRLVILVNLQAALKAYLNSLCFKCVYECKQKQSIDSSSESMRGEKTVASYCCVIAVQL